MDNVKPLPLDAIGDSMPTKLQTIRDSLAHLATVARPLPGELGQVEWLLQRVDELAAVVRRDHTPSVGMDHTNPQICRACAALLALDEVVEDYDA
jgi:hypothetical protein